jgi:hypothetical protein
VPSHTRHNSPSNTALAGVIGFGSVGFIKYMRQLILSSVPNCQCEIVAANKKGSKRCLLK